MKHTRHLFARLSLVLALLVALTSAGLAHRFMPADADETLTAYLAAGGSYADICGDVDHRAMQSCDACRLVDITCLAGVNPAERTDAKHLALAGAVTASVGPALSAFDPLRAARAPPAV